MTSPVAASSDRYIEMTRRFDNQSDGGVDMEVAMAATVFRDLQEAGHIPANARLADRPPNSGTGVSGTSYEARLVELIRDRDSDGRLDLDMDRLQNSGILTGSPSEDTLERVLTNGVRDQLSDEFVGNQDRRSEMQSYGFPNARGRRLQRYSRGMALEGSQDRAQNGFVSEVPGRAAQSAGEANQVAREAIAGAQLLTRQGDQRHGQTLLADTADALMTAGRRDAAAQVYRELQRSPYADTAVNLMQHEIDDTVRQDRDYQAGNDIQLTTRNGTANTIDVSDFRSTYGDLASQRLRAIETQGRMESVLGRPVDPTDMGDAQAYFQAYAQGRTTDEVQNELENYYQSFYVHTGHGVEWSSAIPEDDRPGRMDDLLDQQPRDASGRTLVDCEGYCYMTDRILNGVTNESGERRFDVIYASRPGHVISGVFDRSTGGGFAMNNDQAEALTGDRSTPEGQLNSLGRALSGEYFNVLAFGRTPAAGTETQTSDGAPALGAYIFDGNRVLGGVTPEFQQNYLEWRNQQFGGGSISQYIGHLAQGG